MFINRVDVKCYYEMAIEGKKIAKNTGLLYFRMLLMMVVSLYTSRILLATIGVDDYGIYNVVGGVVVMIGFLSGTMTTTSSRFITVALGHNDMQDMRKTFSSTLLVNLLLALLICLLAETIGLWFLNEKMIIPFERRTAAFWVYQFSIASTVFSIIMVPFRATIIAHEKMGAFAYFSLFDAFARLGVIYLLVISPIDRLVFYAALIFLVHIIDVFIYILYSLIKFEEAKLRISYDKEIVKKIFGFITWSSYGSFVTVGFTQGLNIILNMFFGPAVNAARGIAVQVQHAVIYFTDNFQTAINPQLIKLTAKQNFNDARTLLVASSKYSFFLLCFLGLPIIVETPLVLGIWLKEVPEYTVSFCRIILITSIFGCLANSLRVVNQAEGHIKKFQIYECTLLLLIMPISYFSLKLWQIPLLVFVIHLSIELLAQLVRIAIVVPKIEMTIFSYIKDVYVRILPVFIIPLFMAFLFYNFIPEGILSALIIVAIQELILLFVIFYWGLSSLERVYVLRLIKKLKTKKL